MYTKIELLILISSNHLLNIVNTSLSHIDTLITTSQYYC